MNRKIVLVFIMIVMIVSACSSPTLQPIQTSVPTQTLRPTYTPYPTLTVWPTYTSYPTVTPQPTIVVTRVVVQTPTPDISNSRCVPMTNMDYSDNSKAFILLQAYVASLPDVRQVSYTIPERLYNNSLSHIVHVTYVSDSDGRIYSKRYIVYVKEFGWSDGVFSIDGQCWVDGPHN